jgi:hypothetical protein
MQTCGDPAAPLIYALSVEQVAYRFTKAEYTKTSDAARAPIFLVKRLSTVIS